MNVLLVSQCTKRALTETRRILDQFAERRGERTWQTAITQAGLDTLRKLLRKSARKNTAVACHWIRGKDHSELLWIVGDASQFNAEGAVPTNRTMRDVLRVEDENDWHSLRLMRQLTALAALLHDLGKSCQAFQDRLKPNAPREKNRYRHEWISLRLFQAFVGDDDDASWLQRLAAAANVDDDGKEFELLWLDYAGGRLYRDGLEDTTSSNNKPFATDGRGLPPLAQAVAWLVLTHHRLPALPSSATESEPPLLWHGRTLQSANGAELSAVLSRVDADWNEPWCVPSDQQDPRTIQPYWTFSHGLPVRTAQWRKRAARIAVGLLERAPVSDTYLNDPFLMHVARLTLMLGDHYYSSLKEESQRVCGESDYPLYANTDRATGEYVQYLDEHLLGVELHASQLVHALPTLAGQLSHLIGHRRLKRRSANPTFRWQDRAADLAAGVRVRADQQGAFVVNMASTGCGKTLGNARIMNALADPLKGFRCSFAIGLRTLTLQTGRSFQKDLALADDELAIQVGGLASKGLFEYYERLAEHSGSASRQDLIDETTHVVYEGNDEHPVLKQLGHDAGARKLIAAPLLVCTVDHLTPATESLRGGRQIAPMLRLMTGDLVLDEPDDFDLSDLPALTRLVHWAGLLGARVLLSSATLPPALIEGLFMAYHDGRVGFHKNRGYRPGEAPEICCLWVDEFTQSHADCGDVARFRKHHIDFAQRRNTRLGKQVVRRQAQLFGLSDDMRTMQKAERRQRFSLAFRDAALHLHKHHYTTDPHSSKRISFGLIRMANIGPLFDVALAFFANGVPAGTHIHLCVYHSQYPLFVRSAIEYRLDTILNRSEENAVFDFPEVRNTIESTSAQDQLFIVLGSPVTEVGRDHDYDWAVIEPSSMRSLIQLAGRVLRHRTQKTISYPNLFLCNRNVRSFEQPGEPAFRRPGFEDSKFFLRPHNLLKLLDTELDSELRMPVDARPRTLPRPAEKRKPHSNLIDLEHARLEHQMLPPTLAPVRKNRLTKEVTAGTSLPTMLNATSFWLREYANLTGFLQQVQPFRADQQPDEEVLLIPDEDGDDYVLHRVMKGKTKWERLCVPIEGNMNHRIPDEDVQGSNITAWGRHEIMPLMEQQAEDLDLSLDAFARKYARVNLPQSMNGWRWHPALGFSRAD